MRNKPQVVVWPKSDEIAPIYASFIIGCLQVRGMTFGHFPTTMIVWGCPASFEDPIAPFTAGDMDGFVKRGRARFWV